MKKGPTVRITICIFVFVFCVAGCMSSLHGTVACHKYARESGYFTEPDQAVN